VLADLDADVFARSVVALIDDPRAAPRSAGRRGHFTSGISRGPISASSSFRNLKQPPPLGARALKRGA
jgi:hypothetical protein